MYNTWKSSAVGHTNFVRPLPIIVSQVFVLYQHLFKLCLSYGLPWFMILWILFYDS